MEQAKIANPGGSKTGADQSRWKQLAGSVEQLASLTPLRGIAALWVMVTHFANALPSIQHGRYTGAVSKGHLAVDLFFVLSGFVMTHVYKEWFTRGVTAQQYRNFLKARVARLYPLHIAVLFLFVAAAITEGAAILVSGGSFKPMPVFGERSLIALFGSLLMLQGLWTDQLIWNPPTWSISIEFLAYLLFPLLSSALYRTSLLGKTAIGCLILAVLSWLAYWTGDDFNQHSGAFAIVRGLPEFLAGTLLYSAYQASRSATVLATDTPILVLLLVLGALSHFAAPDLSIVVLFPLLILAAARNKSRFARLLDSKPFLWLGDISYSVYLVHWFVLFMVTETAGQALGVTLTSLPFVTSALLAAAMIAVTSGLATLSYRFIEVPGRRWLRQRLDLRPGIRIAQRVGWLARCRAKLAWRNSANGRRSWQLPIGSVEHLTSLTPLRGVAALWVMIFHFTWYFPNVESGQYTGAVYKGYLAVDLFFVLSGFVLTHVYKEGFNRGVTASRYWNFLKSRIARLYPLHLAVLLLFVAAVMMERAVTYVLNGTFDPMPLIGQRSPIGLLANLAMLQGLWAAKLSWNEPAWSISLEFLAYLLFPLLFPALRRAGMLGKAGIAGLVLTALIWLAYSTGGYFNQWNGPYAILRALPEFVAGVLLYSAYERCSSFPLATDAPLFVVALALGALLHLSAPDLGIVALFPLLILTAARNKGGLAWLLNSRPFVWLGDISYSVYLLHWFVLAVVLESARLIPGFGLGDLPRATSVMMVVAMMGVSLGVATLSYRFVEVPGRRWLRQRLEMRWESRALRRSTGLPSASRA